MLPGIRWVKGMAWIVGISAWKCVLNVHSADIWKYDFAFILCLDDIPGDVIAFFFLYGEPTNQYVSKTSRQEMPIAVSA